jgi:hypothetical protein
MAISTRPRLDCLYHYNAAFDPVRVITSFWRKGLHPTPGVVTNFLGARVQPKIHPESLDVLAGTVEGLPDPGNWHADIAEWGSALRSVRQAKDTYRIVELGCGWGCWLTNMGVAARDAGLRVDLIGIEGNDLHLGNARDTLQLNGFGPDDFGLFHGIAAPRTGQALFPSANAEKSLWNGEAVFYPDTKTLKRAKADPDVQVLDCYPLEKLSDGQVIDLLHIDIQGAEVDYMIGNLDGASRYVRRVLIGTHSRRIEGALMALFLDAGWVLEMERPALTPVRGGKPKTTIDGVQMWANPVFLA